MGHLLGELDERSTDCHVGGRHDGFPNIVTISEYGRHISIRAMINSRSSGDSRSRAASYRASVSLPTARSSGDQSLLTMSLSMGLTGPRRFA